MILHITSKKGWADARTLGSYLAPSLSNEGFIHCSTESQVLPVANAFYRGQSDLVLLVIDAAKLEAELKWEAPAGPAVAGIAADDVFPHIFGPINLEAVAAVVDLVAAPDGNFVLPRLPGIR
jgi:uncharacterized protein (DUF952 family)